MRGEVESQRWWARPQWLVCVLAAAEETPGLVSVSVAMFLSEAGARPRAGEASASERRKWVKVGVGARPEFRLKPDQGHFCHPSWFWHCCRTLITSPPTTLSTDNHLDLLSVPSPSQSQD